MIGGKGDLLQRWNKRFRRFFAAGRAIV